MVTFTDAEIQLIEDKAKDIFGKTFENMTGIPLKEMIEYEDKMLAGKAKLKTLRNKYHRLSIKRAKLTFVINKLNEPNWRQLLKENLGNG